MDKELKEYVEYMGLAYSIGNYRYDNKEVPKNIQDKFELMSKGLYNNKYFKEALDIVRSCQVNK